MTTPAQLFQIAATLQFTLEELAFNRAGRLSPQQTWEATKSALFIGALGLVVLGGLLVAVLVVRPAGFVRVIVYTVGPLSLALLAFLSWGAIDGAVQRRVTAAEGALDLRSNGRGTEVGVGQAHVPISHKASSVLTRGARYRLYYLAGANTFLSIEPVDEGVPAVEHEPPR
ncbi:MAG: hypothetical protein QOI66_1212 [Myxococcales bacterium]|jgi:hypothetical protein|nr:hypothetical protein [Myxococcales bacterium]